MSEQVYVISADDYEYWQLEALLIAPEGIQIESLYQQFKETFQYPPYAEHPAAWDWHDEIAANERVKQSGVEGDDKPELFADWLVKKYGFKRLVFTEVNFNDRSRVSFTRAARIKLLAD